MVLQNACQLQEDNEHLGKRSVDGSETTSSQWELEMQVNIKKLNNVSLENSVHDHDSMSENISNLRFYDEENVKSNNFMPELSCNFLQSKQFSMHNLNQFQKLLKNFKVSENSLRNMSLMTNIGESNTVVLNQCKINFQNRTSKSLNNSPTKMKGFNLESSADNVEITTKYVPHKVSMFGFNNKSQSNSDINLSLIRDSSSIEKYPSLDDILDIKTDNLEFDKQITNSKYNKELYTMNKACNSGLNTTKKFFSAQLNTYSKLNSQLKKEIEPVKESFRSNSTHFLLNTSSSVKLKHVTSLPSENSQSKQLADASSKCSTIKKLTKEPLNIKELPLLSLFEKKNLLANSKGKSYSMINLGDKRNFMLVDNIYLGNTKTVSTGRLGNLKDNLFLRISR